MPVAKPKKKRIPRGPSKLEETLMMHLRAYHLPAPQREFRFHPTRKWRFDFAWPDYKFAVECNGGLYINGGHSRGNAVEEDMEKYHEAMMLGWVIYVCAGRLIDSGAAVKLIQFMLTERMIKQASVQPELFEPSL